MTDTNTPRPQGPNNDSVPAHDLTPEQLREQDKRIRSMGTTIGGQKPATDARDMAEDDPRRKENRPAATVLPTSPLPEPVETPAVRTGAPRAVGAPTRGPGETQ